MVRVSFQYESLSHVADIISHHKLRPQLPGPILKSVVFETHQLTKVGLKP